MNNSDFRNMVKERYKVGQVVSFRIKEADRHGGVKIQVKIIGFYLDFVLTERNGCKESYRYLEFLQLTSKMKEVKLEPETVGHHKAVS